VDNTKIDPGDLVWGGVDQIYLARSMDKWQALVNTVMKLKYRVSSQIVASEVLLNSIRVELAS
jgi:hypothetical protein